MIESEDQTKRLLDQSFCQQCKKSQKIKFIKLQRTKVVDRICEQCKESKKDQYQFKKEYSSVNLIHLAFPEIAIELINGNLNKIDGLSSDIYKNKQLKINQKTQLNDDFYRSVVFAELVHIIIDSKFISELEQSEQLLEVIKILQDKCIILDIQKDLNSTNSPNTSQMFQYLQTFSSQLFLKSENGSQIGSWNNVQHLSYDIDPFSDNHSQLDIPKQFPTLKSIDCSINLYDTSCQQLSQLYEFLLSNIFKLKQAESITLNILSSEEDQALYLSGQSESILDEEEDEEENENSINNSDEMDLEWQNCNNENEEQQIEDDKNSYNSEGEYGVKDTKSQSSEENTKNYKLNHAKLDNSPYLASYKQELQNVDTANISQINKDGNEELELEEEKQNITINEQSVEEINQNNRLDKIFDILVSQQDKLTQLNNLKSLSLFYESYQETDENVQNILNRKLLKFIANYTGNLSYFMMDIHLNRQLYPSFSEILLKNNSITDIELSLDNLKLSQEQYLHLFTTLHKYQLQSVKFNLQQKNQAWEIIVEQIASLIHTNSTILKNLEIYLLSGEEYSFVQDQQAEYCKEELFKAISKNSLPCLRNICLIIDKQFSEGQKRSILENVINNCHQLQTMQIETKINDLYKKYKKMREYLCYITQAIYSKHRYTFRKDLLYHILESYISFQYIEYTSI